MLRWITKTRLRTVLAMLVAIFGPAILVAAIYFLWGLISHNAGPAAETGGELSASSSSIAAVVLVLTSITTVCGTISTVILAWKADRRASEEAHLKNLQLQQQIIELQQRLESTQGINSKLG